MKKRIWAALLVAALLVAGAASWAAADVLPRSVSIAATAKVLGLAQGSNPNDKVRVIPTFKPASAKAMIRVYSNRPQVADAKLDDQGWYLQAAAPGSALITAVVQKAQDGGWADTGIRHRIQVTVKRSVRLTYLACSPRKLSLYQGEGYDLSQVKLKFRPSNADCVDEGGQPILAWSSSKPSVAVVENGQVVAVGKGSCKLYGRTVDGCGKKVTISLTVKTVAPKGITLSDTSAIVKVGEAMSLTYALTPQNATNQQVKWLTSNPLVASVDDGGKVTALKAGSALITCQSLASSKVRATCLVKVEQGPLEGTVYRVYTVANAQYPGYSNMALPSTLNDQRLISGAYGFAKGAGMQVTSVTNKQNLTANQIELLLQSMAQSGADEDDVSVFFYTGHGQAQTGALVGSDMNMVSVAKVRSYLDQVPGTVILILDSCYSGQYATGKSAVTPSQFNRMVIDAFAGGVQARSAGGSKFKVITACAANQESWCISSYGFFSYLAGGGLGCVYPGFSKGKLQADASGDGQVTLFELYRHVQGGMPELLKKYSVAAGQDVQMWPSGDQTAVLTRQGSIISQ